MKKGIYIASRASLPQRSATWRTLRDEGYPIISSWIDEIDKTYRFETPEESEEFISHLWLRFSQEIQRAERLIVYAEPDDFPLKGTLVEVGIALGCNTPVYLVLPGVDIEADTYRPVGSWINHPLVKQVASLEEALAGTR